METIFSFFVLLTGIFIRLLIPFAITGLVVLVLRKLDAHWQAEAMQESDLLRGDEILCWREQGLSISEIKLRASLSGKPCWQIHLSSNGYLREVCLDCDVFREYVTLRPKHSHVHI
jgi:hypothetical protein